MVIVRYDDAGFDALAKGLSLPVAEVAAMVKACAEALQTTDHGHRIHFIAMSAKLSKVVYLACDDLSIFATLDKDEYDSLLNLLRVVSKDATTGGIHNLP